MSVLEGRLVKVVEHRVGRRIKHRFDFVESVVQPEARVWVWVQSGFQIRFEQTLQESVDVCVVGSAVRYGAMGPRC